MNRRIAILGTWSLTGLLVVFSGVVGANSGTGLLAPTVCLSPLMFLFAVVTPPETLANLAASKLGIDEGDE